MPDWPVNQNVKFVYFFCSLAHWIQVIIMVCGFFLCNILWFFPFLFIPTAITIVKSFSLHPENSLNRLLVDLLSPVSPYPNPSYSQLLNLPLLWLKCTVASYCLLFKPELISSILLWLSTLQLHRLLFSSQVDLLTFPMMVSFLIFCTWFFLPKLSNSLHQFPPTLLKIQPEQYSAKPLALL